MCSVCRRIPCDPRCPNAEEDKRMVCIECGHEIEDEYLDALDGPICSDCLDRMFVRDVLEAIGVRVKIR